MANPKTCDRCPNKGKKRGCPCWVGPEARVFETNLQTGEERLVEGCFYEVVIRMLSHTIAAANRPAAALESLRNVMVELTGPMGRAAPRTIGGEVIDNAPQK